MKLPLMLAAVKAMTDQVEQRLLRYEGRGDFTVLPLRAKMHKLRDVLRLLQEQRPINELQPYARFLAFVTLVAIKLPQDGEKLMEYGEELKQLGFDMWNLSISSVFDEPISGKDFA